MFFKSDQKNLSYQETEKKIRPGDGCTPWVYRPANHAVATFRPWPSSHFWN